MKKPNLLLWWKVSADEVQKQVDGYNSLPWHMTARKSSAALLGSTTFFTAFCVLYGATSPWAYFDAAIALFLAVHVDKGRKWAILGAMLFWTFEKGYAVFAGMGHGPGTLHVLWWSVYMSAFYTAFLVERARGKPQPPEEIQYLESA